MLCSVFPIWPFLENFLGLYAPCVSLSAFIPFIVALIKFTLSLLSPTVPLGMGAISFIAAFYELGIYFRLYIQDISVVDGGKGIF